MVRDDLICLLSDRFNYFGFDVGYYSDYSYAIYIAKRTIGYIVLTSENIAYRFNRDAFSYGAMVCNDYGVVFFLKYDDLDIDMFVGLFLCEAYYGR